MIIRNKFNGYGFDGSRLCHDPVSLSIAATQAGAASSAAAAALAAKTAAATTAATTAATAAAGKTAALELAKKEAISAGMKQAGTEAAKQGIAQAGQQAGVEAAKQTGVEAAKQGIFSGNPAGMPPTAQPLPPAGSTPLPPAGGTPFTPPTTPPPTAGAEMTLEQQLAQIQANPTDTSKFAEFEKVANAGNNTPLVEKAAYDPSQSLAFKTNATTPVDPSTAYLQPKIGTHMGPDTFANVAKESGGINQLIQPQAIPPNPNAFPLSEPSALQKGFETGLNYVKDNPITTGMGLMSAGQYMNKPEEEDKDKYKNTVDMSEFKYREPTQPSFTRSYEYQNYQSGGPVEDMSRMNSLGANTGYPMANLQTPMYSNPAMQRPEATNVIAPSADAGVNTYSGEARFAEGGLSAAQRREYGLSTRGQRAARGLTASYEEMEAERQKEAMRLMGERSDPGIVPRSRTQMMSSPFSAAQAEHARLGKKSKVPVVAMPKTNLGDIDNYMDIPIEAAQGGIMRYASGGETQYGVKSNPNHVNPENYTRSQLAGGMRPTAPTAPVMTAPKYTAPVQQAYTPISYQQPQAQPQPQQSDMSDFYSSMDQQLGNYGFAEGGIMHGLGGYSDGGRLLRGPGDGVSDSIPAVIGKRQPARLADGEFVIPARIVSELGNGSTEAGARKLYAMMERVQATRKKSIGKKKVAVNSKSDKHLPA